MGAYLSLAVLFVELFFLAIVLGAVGYGLIKLSNLVRESRRAQKMREESLVEVARARAKARAAARAKASTAVF